MCQYVCVVCGYVGNDYEANLDHMQSISMKHRWRHKPCSRSSQCGPEELDVHPVGFLVAPNLAAGVSGIRCSLEVARMRCEITARWQDREDLVWRILKTEFSRVKAAMLRGYS